MTAPAIRPLSNAELIAELRCIAVAVRVFGLDALPHVLVGASAQPSPSNTVKTGEG